MRMLDRKLMRDLRHMWAQALAIALVIASGVATFVLASGAYHSLEETRATYYLRYRFADIFAEVRRARNPSPTASLPSPASPPQSRASPTWRFLTFRAWPSLPPVVRSRCRI